MKQNLKHLLVQAFTALMIWFIITSIETWIYKRETKSHLTDLALFEIHDYIVWNFPFENFKFGNEINFFLKRYWLILEAIETFGSKSHLISLILSSFMKNQKSQSFVTVSLYPRCSWFQLSSSSSITKTFGRA